MRPKFITVTVMALFIAFIAFACSDQSGTEATDNDVAASEVKKEAKEALDTAGAYTAQQKEAYLKQIEARINELGQKIDEYQATAESKTAVLEKDAQEALNQTMAKLRQQKQDAAERFEKLKTSSGRAWDDLKSGLDDAVDKLSKALDRTGSEFES